MAVGASTEGDFEPPDLQGFAKTIVNNLVSVENLERAAKSLEPVLIKIVEVLVGTIIGVAAPVASVFAEGIVNAENNNSAAFERLTRVALKDITGVDANLSPGLGGRDGRSGGARNVGAGILKALSGISGGGSGTGGTLAPGTQAAEDYLTFVVQMAIEGWLTGTIGELVTLGAVENLGDLDDALANSLGLARTSRAVMRPFINTTVALPAQWQMNKTYRPELLSASLAVKMFNRKRWTKEQMMEELARQGFSDDRIEALMQDAEQKPPLALVMKALQFEYVNADDVRTYLSEQGYPDTAATFIIEMQEVESIGNFQRDLADAAAAAYVARRITPGKFYQLLNDAGIPQRDMNRLRELSELKRAVNVKPLNEADAETAAKRKIISIPEYRQVLQDLGYSDNAIYVKELLLQGDINDTAQKERAAAARARELADEKAAKLAAAEERKRQLELERAVTEPSLGMVERFVTRGYWDFQQYADYLRSEKYDSTTISALVADAEQARINYVAQQAERAEAERRAATRTIGLATLESAVLRGHATMADYRQRLTNDKYIAADVATLVAVLQDRIDEQKELEDRRREAEARAHDKGLSAAQFEQSVLKGVTSLSDFDAFLQSEGYPSFDRSVIVQLAAAKLDEQQAAAQRRDQVEAAAAARKVPVADIRRGVLAGVRTMADYRNALIDAHVGADDRVLLEELLQADIDAKLAAEQRRDEIAREREQRGLSLQQLERAVVIGAATVDDYQQELSDEGYDDDAIHTLTALLLERIQQTQRARTRRDELDAEDEGKTTTPAQVAAAVRVGIRTPTDYFNALLVNGNNEADATLLTQLLELELAEATDAKTTRATVTADVGDPSVNLAQLAAAVRAGEVPIDTYAAAVAARGYSPATVSTLRALLANEMEDAGAAAIVLDEETKGDKTKQLSVSQFENTVVAGARTIPEYVQYLVDQGFSLAAQSSLVALLLQRLDKNAGVTK